MKISINKSVLETILLNTQPYLEKKDLSQITSHLYISSLEKFICNKSYRLRNWIRIPNS